MNVENTTVIKTDSMSSYDKFSNMISLFDHDVLKFNENMKSLCSDYTETIKGNVYCLKLRLSENKNNCQASLFKNNALTIFEQGALNKYMEVTCKFINELIKYKNKNYATNSCKQ